MAGLSAYGRCIVEFTGCRPEDTHQTEEVMRDEHSTLDGLTRQRLRGLAKRSWEAVKQLRVEEPGLFPTPG